ncbi:MAG: ABC transporter permease [Bacteroidota bacterium]|nr:ABC transporter permease [Bacteroidota bacterium]
MRRTSSFYLFSSLLGGLALLFIIAPLLGLMIKSTWPELYQVSQNRDVRESIALTLGTSMLGTFLLAIPGIPLAYLLARKQFPFRKFVIGLVDLPVVIPHSAAGIALLGFLSNDSFFGRGMAKLGIDFIGQPAGIAMAMAFVSLPFLLNAARDGFASVPIRLEQAALNLGATPSRVFFTISLPLAWRSILSGLIMMFARGMSEFGAVVIIAYHPMTSSVMLWEWFGAYGLKYARPIAVLVIMISLIFFILLRLLSKNEPLLNRKNKKKQDA